MRMRNTATLLVLDTCHYHRCVHASLRQTCSIVRAQLEKAPSTNNQSQDTGFGNLSYECRCVVKRIPIYGRYNANNCDVDPETRTRGMFDFRT